jgi:hypothetical protein
MKLLRPGSFHPVQDLAAIAGLAQAWRGQFRPARVSHTPGFFLAQLEDLAGATIYRLYLVTRPLEPVPLAILEGLTRDDVIDLLALAPSDGPDLVRPLAATPTQRREMMAAAQDNPAGQGVFPFLLGQEGGMAWLDLEPEGLVLTMARWGGANVLDPAPLLAGRLRLLGQRLQDLAAPPEDEA